MRLMFFSAFVSSPVVMLVYTVGSHTGSCEMAVMCSTHVIERSSWSLTLRVKVDSRSVQRQAEKSRSVSMERYGMEWRRRRCGSVRALPDAPTTLRSENTDLLSPPASDRLLLLVVVAVSPRL